MNKFDIIKSQGGVPKALPGEDHISGLLFYSNVLPGGFSASDRVKAISTLAAAEALGITADNADWTIKVMHYHISEAIRQNNGIMLYVGIFAIPTGAYNYAEIAQIQSYAEGKIHQVGVWVGYKLLAAADITAMQTVANQLSANYQNLSIVATGKVHATLSLIPDLHAAGNCNVSVEIGQDGTGLGNDLYTDASNTTAQATVGLMGLTIGMLSKAAVHESISWVQNFPSGIDVPALGNGILVRTIDRADLNSLDSKRYLFLIKQTGLTGSYFNDSHNMDLSTSDYNMIESERAIDKAIRGIHLYLLPFLSSPLYINPANGQLRSDTVGVLKNEAGRVLEQMERAGELSGYKVDIDQEQDVLSTSSVEIVIKNVAVGVLRHLSVKIGYTTQIS